MSTACGWGIAWVGECKRPATTCGRCAEHAGKTCVCCGAAAVRECHQTVGPLVCGHPLCRTCRHVPNTYDKHEVVTP